ncbi:MaoC family dehydratase [Thermoproteus tenax]|uniref:MaoC family proteine n=1 Tax=Thermoproteus tenax (strain ATCC 35583 / DSM 2078 / JCM 9277 / NBRC 100435 / Kra 1) TaxID=768679 RepID=G4RMD8_THETK|nr:MaoC/PaaZ C-terminal domain-containing protein [Thermoproteus tenax]CCC80769.1 MaoC family proteine [Thermoproteus tenax Kra 1]
MGLTYDEFQPGARIVSHGVTVTESHIVQFAGLTGDHNPLHLDEAYAKGTIFGGRIAHGLLTLSLAVGLIAHYLYGTTIALLEAGGRFLKPVKIGDTIRVEAEVVDKRPSEKYDGGIVHLRLDVKNDRGDTVAVAEIKALVSRKRWQGST